MLEMEKAGNSFTSIVFPDYKAASANAKNAVIPAWMSESRAREGDYPWHRYPI